MAPIDFNKALNKAVADDKKQWGHDRSQTVGASEVFGCIRRNYFTKREPEKAKLVEVDDAEWGAMERGNAVENHWAVPKLKLMFGDENCLFMGDEQKTLVSGRLSSTSDGLVINQPRDILAHYGIEDLGSDCAELAIEIKSVDPNTDLSEVKFRHKVQNIVQMGLYGEQTNFRPLYGAVLYFNPVNLKKVKPFVIRFDDGIYQTAKARAAAVFEPSFTQKDFKAEGKITGECQYCPFAHECKEAEIRAFPQKVKRMDEIPQEDTERLEQLSRRIASVRKDISALDKEKTEAEEELKELLAELGTKKAVGNDWSATYSQIQGRKSLDTGALSNALENMVNELEQLRSVIGDDKVNELIALARVDNYYKEGQPYFRLTVKG